MEQKILVTVVTGRAEHEGQRILEVAEGSTIEEVVRRLNLLPDECIVMRNSVPVPLTEELHDKDLIKIIRVASGG
ncbi:MAG: MoaD/ThiS family protein [Methanomassiliicoccales archaeon]